MVFRALTYSVAETNFSVIIPNESMDFVTAQMLITGSDRVRVYI